MNSKTSTVVAAATSNGNNNDSNNKHHQNDDDNSNIIINNNNKYRSVVIDSGPIIKLTGVSALRQRADHFYTVPAVLAEIRDAKARQHLDTLPFDIQTREPMPSSIQAVTEFARLTGDYQSLSSVDLQVLALVYELEVEGCVSSNSSGCDHIRRTPKRTVGVGKVQLLNSSGKKQTTCAAVTSDDAAADVGGRGESKDENEEFGELDYDEVHSDEEDEEEESRKETANVAFFEGSPSSSSSSSPPEHQLTTVNKNDMTKHTTGPSKSWAMLVNPAAAAAAVEITQTTTKVVDVALHVSFGKMNLSKEIGQFSDAEEEDVGEKKEDVEHTVIVADGQEEGNLADLDLEKELQKDFPSLAASLHVPYEGEDYGKHDNDDNEIDREQMDQKEPLPSHATMKTAEITEEERKSEAVMPVSKSGKLYNSCRGYGKLFKPAPKKTVKKDVLSDKSKEGKGQRSDASALEALEEIGYEQSERETQSRIIGGVNMSGQDVDVEDDGEGWITCTKDIRSLQTTGTLAPTKNPSDNDSKTKQGPPLHQRTACATTDFAMQNVLLQMNLELLSVDGVKLRRLKNWVTRCGACFRVYTRNDDAGPHGMKRLFCERCGSDMLQRIAASVDGRNGRLRLHMSKKHKTSTRGTKYSLPKPGTGNRFQGDLLLREDQLLTGAWNQKVKIRSGGKAKSAAQSMFGQDIAANVGCRAKSMNVDDIAAGFGRRNPNSAKGRERRGKKKKSSEKACGLRRYH